MTLADTPEQEFLYAGPSCRLDHFLSRHLGDISRSRLQDLVRKGAVLVNGREVKTSYRLKDGDLVRVTIPSPEPLALPAQDLPLRVVYEDSHLIVVDKAAGMVVHPAVGHQDGTLVNALLFHCGDLAGIGGVQRPGIVHRLDQDTSGLLVVAKDDFTHQGLAAQFREHSIARRYTALAYGRLLPVSGSFVSEIGRHPRHRKKMASVPSGGKPARTNYRVLRYFPQALCSLVSLELETGRTHQIRVHLSEAGYPLVGDRVYGQKGARRRSEQTPALKLLSAFPRQALHAGHLGFVHPVRGEYLEFDSPLPDDFHNLLECLDEMAQGA